MGKKVVLVKLGGSLITNKSKPFSERKEVIVNLVSQIKKAFAENGRLIVVGHGGGSYPHVPAEKYDVINGKVNGQSVYGAAMVEDAAAQLNRIVVGEFLRQSIPAISVNPSSALVLNNRKVSLQFFDAFVEMMRHKIIPIIYGDVIFDKKIGFSIFSTEQLLNLYASYLLRGGFKVEKVIHCGETDGLIVDGEVLPQVNRKNFKKVKKSIYKTSGFDVTGGMLHKVQQGLSLSGKGVNTYIVGGNHGGNLYRSIVGERFIGTKITN